jgi:hypothetical protein
MLPFTITTKKIKKELQTIQNTCLKIITGQPRRTSTLLVHKTLKIEKIDKRLAMMSCNYLAKSKQYNDTVSNILNEHANKIIIPKRLKRSILDRINLTTLMPILSTTQF